MKIKLITTMKTKNNNKTVKNNNYNKGKNKNFK